MPVSENFYTAVIVNDPRYHSTERINDMALLEPVTRAAVTAIIEEAESQYGIVLQVTETYRSRERQAQLFSQGATHLKDVGTHHWGISADFIKLIQVGGHTEGSYSGDWAFLGKLGTEHGFAWGGAWGDYDHIQRCTLAQQAGLFAGTWYPA